VYIKLVIVSGRACNVTTRN